VDERATVTAANARPDFQPMRSENGCFTAEVEFVVDTLGVPEQGTQRLVRATTPAFGDAVLAIVPSLRYQPARLAGARVRQIVSERRTAQVGTIVVAKGSAPPPSMAGSTGHAPNC
jgi:hypothetical protein